MSSLEGSDVNAQSDGSNDHDPKIAELQDSFLAGPETWLLRHSTGDGAESPQISQLASSSQPPGPWRSPTLAARRARQSGSVLSKPLAFAKLLQSGILSPYLTTERKGEGVKLDDLQIQLPDGLAHTNFSFTMRKSTGPASTKVHCNLFWDLQSDTHGRYKVGRKEGKREAMGRPWRSDAASEPNDTAQPLLSNAPDSDTEFIGMTEPEHEGPQGTVGADNQDAIHTVRDSSRINFSSQPNPDTIFFQDNRSPLPGSKPEHRDGAGENILDFDKASDSDTPAWRGRLRRATLTINATHREPKVFAISIAAGQNVYTESKPFPSGNVTAVGDKPSETANADAALILIDDLNFDTLCARIIPGTPQ